LTLPSPIPSPFTSPSTRLPSLSGGDRGGLSTYKAPHPHTDLDFILHVPLQSLSSFLPLFFYWGTSPFCEIAFLTPGKNSTDSPLQDSPPPPFLYHRRLNVTMFRWVLSCPERRCQLTPFCPIILLHRTCNLADYSSNFSFGETLRNPLRFQFLLRESESAKGKCFLAVSILLALQEVIKGERSLERRHQSFP